MGVRGQIIFVTDPSFPLLLLTLFILKRLLLNWDKEASCLRQKPTVVLFLTLEMRKKAIYFFKKNPSPHPADQTFQKVTVPKEFCFCWEAKSPAFLEVGVSCVSCMTYRQQRCGPLRLHPCRLVAWREAGGLLHFMAWEVSPLSHLQTWKRLLCKPISLAYLCPSIPAVLQIYLYCSIISVPYFFIHFSCVH